MAGQTIDYDMLVIGAGTGGLVAAQFAVAIGAKTALVEREKIGGDCTWYGCVPSKTLVRIARAAHDARSSAHFGVLADGVRVDMRQVRAHIQHTVGEIYQYETPEMLAKKGIHFLHGDAHFTDPHTITLNGSRAITARKFILATGARPVMPPIGGLADVPFLTYRTIFDLDELPRHLLIVGDGPIACEMAHAYRRLGSEVTLVGERLLPRDEPEAAQMVEAVFAREGIRRMASCASVVGNSAGDEITLTAENGETARGSHLLIATGRTPYAGNMGLENAGVTVNDGMIPVNTHLQTSADHIYAVGDCTGGYQFTHYAGWQGYIAARNALLPLNENGINDMVPWVTFVDPEIAHAGMTEAQARQQFGNRVRVQCVPAAHIDRAMTDGDGDAFLKVVSLNDGRLLGATVAGKGAGETIAEYCLALHHKMKLGAMAKAFHPYPTYSTATQLVASEIAQEQTLGGLTGRLIKALRT